MLRTACTFLFILMSMPATAQTRSTALAPDKLDHPPLAHSDAEKRILAVIGEAVRKNELYANVPALDGHLTTMDIDAERIALAREHFQQAGVDSLVTIVQGDAHANIAKLKGPFDIVFIDAEKPGYVDYLNRVLPLVRPGGLILAHNIEMVPDYVKAITTNPVLDTVFYMQGNQLAVTLKKR